eukprot:2817930-Rhodomonas_salina.1
MAKSANEHIETACSESWHDAGAGVKTGVAPAGPGPERVVEHHPNPKGDPDDLHTAPGISHRCP